MEPVSTPGSQSTQESQYDTYPIDSQLLNLPEPFKPYTGKRIFDPIWENGECTLHLNESVTVPERRTLAPDLPSLLHSHRCLTTEELSSIGFQELHQDQIIYAQAPNGRHPAAARISAQWLKDHGLLERLVALREKLLNEEYKQKLLEVSTRAKSQFLEITGTRFSLGITNKPHVGASSSQLGPLARASEEIDAQAVITELTDIVSEAANQFIPSLNNFGREERFYQSASLMVGSKKNRQFTSVQLNYSREQQQLQKSLKKFGGVHRDILNDPTSLAAVVSLSHFSEDYFGGRFNVTPYRVTVPLLPFEIILFSARNFHGSSGVGVYSVPRGSPLRTPAPLPALLAPLPAGTEFSRFNVVLYANERQSETVFRRWNKELYTERGQVVFQDQAHHVEWMVRTYIVNEAEIRARNGNKRYDEPGSGPQQLISAAKTCLVDEDIEALKFLSQRIERVGDATHYASLFQYIDSKTGKTCSPDINDVKKTLDAISSQNEPFEKLKEDMRFLGKGTVGIIPGYTSSSRPRPSEFSSPRPKKRKRNPDGTYTVSPSTRWKYTYAYDREPVIVDGEVEWEIEKVVAKRPTKKGKWEYKIRWKGWGKDWDEWKTERELVHARKLIDIYERKCMRWDRAVEEICSSEGEWSDDETDGEVEMGKRKMVVVLKGMRVAQRWAQLTERKTPRVEVTNYVSHKPLPRKAKTGEDDTAARIHIHGLDRLRGKIIELHLSFGDEVKTHQIRVGA